MSIAQGTQFIKRLANKLTGRTTQSGLNRDGTLAVVACKNGSTDFMAKLRAASKNQLSPAEKEHIERRYEISESKGALPLWEGYRTLEGYPRDTVGTRSTSEVSTPTNYGSFYVGLIAQFKPKTIVEFGGAFGVSGMYFLTGVNRAKSGHLYSFEPNAAWAKIAQDNLNSISPSHTLQVGTFEENVDRVVKDKINLAFVDAIHTAEFVNRQVDILMPRMADYGVMIFDDINFSEDMQSCWQAISQSNLAVASATVGRRQGIIQIRA